MSKEIKNSLLVDKDWCKGCGICVSACSKEVLEMKGEKIHIKNIERCIYCQLCEMKCPDYAIYIEKEE